MTRRPRKKGSRQRPPKPRTRKAPPRGIASRKRETIPKAWRTLSAALGAEPRDYPKITGSSGIEHEFLAVAVDDKTRRVILLSAEPDPRLVALVQSDIQSTMPENRVLIARSAAFDLTVIATNLANFLGTDTMTVGEIKKFFSDTEKLSPEQMNAQMMPPLGENLKRMIEVSKHFTIPVLSQIFTVFRQAALLDWDAIKTAFQDGSPDNYPISMKALVSADNFAQDRQYGICPIPLYEFTENDWSLLERTGNLDAVQNRLNELGVYKFFFPAKDELVVGYVDRGMRSTEGLAHSLERTAELGHCISASTFAGDAKNFVELVEILKAMGFLTEGEVGLETGEKGSSYRLSVKARPQESVFDRILKRFSINVNLNPTQFQ